MLHSAVFPPIAALAWAVGAGVALGAAARGPGLGAGRAQAAIEVMDGIFHGSGPVLTHEDS